MPMIATGELVVMYSTKVNQRSLWANNYLEKALMEIREELK